MIEDIYRKIKNQIFIVTVPKIATYTDFDYDIGGIKMDIKNGRPVETDHTRPTVVGLPIVRIAEMALEGMPVYTQSRDEILHMYRLLNDFITEYDSIAVLPNTQQGDKEEYDMIYEFARMMVENQEHVIRNGTITFEKKIQELGIINPNKVDTENSKHKYTHTIIKPVGQKVTLFS